MNYYFRYCYYFPRVTSFALRMPILFLLEDSCHEFSCIKRLLPTQNAFFDWLQDGGISRSCTLGVMQCFLIGCLVTCTEYLVALYSLLLTNVALLLSYQLNEIFFTRADLERMDFKSSPVKSKEIFTRLKSSLVDTLWKQGVLSIIILLFIFRTILPSLFWHGVTSRLMFDSCLLILVQLSAIGYCLFPPSVKAVTSDSGYWITPHFIHQAPLHMISLYVFFGFIYNLPYLSKFFLYLPFNFYLYIEFLGVIDFFYISWRRIRLSYMLVFYWLIHVTCNIHSHRDRMVILWSSKIGTNTTHTISHWLAQSVCSYFDLAGLFALISLVYRGVAYAIGRLAPRDAEIYLGLSDMVFFNVFYFSCVQDAIITGSNRSFIFAATELKDSESEQESKYIQICVIHNYLLAVLCFLGFVRAFIRGSFMRSHKERPHIYHWNALRFIAFLSSTVIWCLVICAVSHYISCSGSLPWWKNALFYLFWVKICWRTITQYVNVLANNADLNRAAEQSAQLPNSEEEQDNVDTGGNVGIGDNNAESWEFYVKLCHRLVDCILDMLLVALMIFECALLKGNIISVCKILSHVFSNAKFEKRWSLMTTIYRHIMADHLIDRMPNASSQQLHDLNDICAVCRGNMTSAKVTSCGHYYHALCLRRWLRVRASCPLCHNELQ